MNKEQIQRQFDISNELMKFISCIKLGNDVVYGNKTISGNWYQLVRSEREKNMNLCYLVEKKNLIEYQIYWDNFGDVDLQINGNKKG